MSGGAWLARHRRALAAVLAAAGVGFGLLAVRPPAPPTVRVLAAAHDLPGGTTLRGQDVRAVALPAAAVPDGALRSGARGRVLAGPMRRGEPLTDARLLGAGLLDGYGPDVVATPVRIADAGVARLLRPGDRVDVLATAASPFEDAAPAVVPPTRTLVSAVPVLAVPRQSLGDQGALIVLATGRQQAGVLAGAGSRLSVTITTGPD
jgi:Flp pilus assembly protein CpaB